MQTNNTPPTESDAQQPAYEGLDDAICSSDIPFDSPTPHTSIEKVIEWLGIGYESTITRKSDGKKITIRITDGNLPNRQALIKGAIQEVRKIDCGLWLSDRPEGKQKRIEMMHALDRLYKAADLTQINNEVEKCIVCGGDEPCSHDFDKISWPNDKHIHPEPTTNDETNQ